VLPSDPPLEPAPLEVLEPPLPEPELLVVPSAAPPPSALPTVEPPHAPPLPISAKAQAAKPVVASFFIGITSPARSV
jgi:hypothetical protein